MDKKEERELLKLAKPLAKIYLEKLSKDKDLKRKTTNLQKKKYNLEEKKELQKDIKIIKKDLTKLEEKIKKIKKESKEALRSLLNYNQKLVKYIAPGYYLSNKLIDPEELISEGNFSLIKAIDKFELDSKNRFSTYAVIWIKTYISNFINYKSQFINQSPLTKNKKNIVYYESNQVEDEEGNENKNYSLSDTLEEKDDLKMEADEINQKDLMIELSHLINSLEERDAIILTRMEYKINPVNLLDIYFLLKKNEKERLLKKIDLEEPIDHNKLRSYFIENYKNIPIVKKYLKLVSSSHTLSDLSSLLQRTETSIIKLRKESLQKFQKIAKESNLSSF